MATFGEVIEELKKGNIAYRKGWNGIEAEKEMFIWEEDSYGRHYGRILANELRLGKFKNTDIIEFNNFICLYLNGEVIPGWLASQTDMLANDWVIEEVDQ